MVIDIDTSFRQKNDIVQWIRDWFDKNGKDCNAIIGISGGKDSSIVAALCVEALGKDRVIGIQMPNGVQTDINYADEIIEYLDIKHYKCNIEDAFMSIFNFIGNTLGPNNITDQTIINLPPRLRMSVLYAYSQSLNGRVANTCNMSETFVGYETIFGDAAGDFAPLKNYTVSEVIGIGRALRLPDKFINKVSSDGLCGKSDEDSLGVTYNQIDNFISSMEGVPTKEFIENAEANKKIQTMHEASQFKRDKINIPGPNNKYL